MEDLKKQVAKILQSKEDFLLEHKEVPAAEEFYRDILYLLSLLFKEKNIFSSKLPIRVINCLSIYSVLLKEKKRITTRELFYRVKSTFIRQKDVSSSLRTILTRTKIQEEALRVIPSLKGMVYGECAYILKENAPVHLVSGVSLIPQMDEVQKVLCNYEILLVVEKEAIFTSICQDIKRIEESLGKRVLLITGKGYPCRNTLKFLMKIEQSKIFGLFDCDPHGIDIYTVYKNGSKNHPNLKVPSLRRIGVSLKETDSLLLSIHTSKEIQMLKRLSTVYTHLNAPLDASLIRTHKDIQDMLQTGKKASIEDVFKTQTVSQYLSIKIKEDLSTH
ncbi:meiotic recombination protein SPO11 [Nematocida sp. LUAm1]|nr:meiotic recombination protein SPO11 [Nematocida sp. LUAm1]